MQGQPLFPFSFFNPSLFFCFGVFFLFFFFRRLLASFLVSETEALGKIGEGALSGSQVAVEACR